MFNYNLTSKCYTILDLYSLKTHFKLLFSCFLVRCWLFLFLRFMCLNRKISLPEHEATFSFHLCIFIPNTQLENRKSCSNSYFQRSLSIHFTNQFTHCVISFVMSTRLSSKPFSFAVWVCCGVCCCRASVPLQLKIQIFQLCVFFGVFESIKSSNAVLMSTKTNGYIFFCLQMDKAIETMHHLDLFVESFTSFSIYFDTNNAISTHMLTGYFGCLQRLWLLLLLRVIVQYYPQLFGS